MSALIEVTGVPQTGTVITLLRMPLNGDTVSS